MNVRPEILDIDDKTLKVECFTQFKVYSKDEFADILIFPTLVLAKKDQQDSKFPLPVDEKMFTKELGFKFNGYTYGIGKIVRLAEINSDHLHNFITDYFFKNDIKDFYQRNANCAKVREYKIEEKSAHLTFGNLKNILRLIIKTDAAFYEIEELNDSNKRSNFRKTYDNYVVDRDRFTHGKLFFLYPDFNPILRIKEKDGKDCYINYSQEIFLSNLHTYDYLEKVLAKMTQVLDRGNEELIEDGGNI